MGWMAPWQGRGGCREGISGEAGKGLGSPSWARHHLSSSLRLVPVKHWIPSYNHSLTHSFHLRLVSLRASENSRLGPRPGKASPRA